MQLDPVPPRLTLRPAVSDDLESVFVVTKAAMGPYVEATWGTWDDSVQRDRVAETFSACTHQLIYLGTELAGVLAVKVHPDHLQLLKVFLLPAFQRRGFGTMLVKQVIERAETDGLPVRLRVLRVNPAKALYERLGFVVTHEEPERFFMERKRATH
ncbi:MAG: GNAT family N-acetyltransferase [Burkholderiaceae bacterium]